MNDGIKYVHQDLIVPIICVTLMILLFVKLTNVNLNMEIMVHMDLVLVYGIHLVILQLIVMIISVQMLIIYYVLQINVLLIIIMMELMVNVSGKHI